MSREAWNNLLADAGPTTLDQQDQHDNAQRAGYDSDKRGGVHVDSPFLLLEKFLELFAHDDHRWPQCDEEQTWKDEKHERKDQLDGRLGRHFLHRLDALRPHHVGVRAQGLGDAGAELLCLHDG